MWRRIFWSRKDCRGDGHGLSEVETPMSRVIMIEVLPEHSRNEFNIPLTIYTRQMFKLITGVNATVTPYLPMSVREFQKNYFMSDSRRRIATGSRL